MSVSATDLLYPTGELREEWFPGEDLPANLTAWIAEGEAQAPSVATPAQTDTLSVAFAYWRAYDAKLMLLAASPDTVSLEGIGVGVKDSRGWWSKKAVAWRAAFDAAVVAASETEIEMVTSAPRTSGSTRYTVGF